MTLWIHIQAPFAAFRWLQAGVYRASSPVIPPSAAWGLLLNMAGVDVRGKTDAPPLCLAIGEIKRAGRTSLLQQLHSYPVGACGKDFAARSFGAKYWISPVRREVLVDLNCIIGARTMDPHLEDRIASGIRGEGDWPRYGLPFAGDNNFLIDRMEALDSPPEAFWYRQAPHGASCRLTASINRKDNSKTKTVLFSPTQTKTTKPPPDAWIWTPSVDPGADQALVQESVLR